MKVNLIGVMKGTYEGKDGKTKEASTMYFTQPFSQYESGRDGMECLGLKVGTAFFPHIIDAKAGDQVELEYEPGFQDKATLVNVKVVARAKE